MTIKEVLVPGYLISGSLLQSGNPTSLAQFGSVPFSILCQANHLRTSPPSSFPSSSSSHLQDSHSAGLQVTTLLPLLEDPLAKMSSDDSPSTDMFPSDSEEMETSIAVEQSIAQSSSDCDAQEAIAQLLLDIKNFDTSYLNVVHAHVVGGDIWHLFHQFPISMNHGL